MTTKLLSHDGRATVLSAVFLAALFSFAALPVHAGGQGGSCVASWDEYALEGDTLHQVKTWEGPIPYEKRKSIPYTVLRKQIIEEREDSCITPTGSTFVSGSTTTVISLQFSPNDDQRMVEVKFLCTDAYDGYPNMAGHDTRCAKTTSMYKVPGALVEMPAPDLELERKRRARLAAALEGDGHTKATLRMMMEKHYHEQLDSILSPFLKSDRKELTNNDLEHAHGELDKFFASKFQQLPTDQTDIVKALLPLRATIFSALARSNPRTCAAVWTGRGWNRAMEVASATVQADDLAVKEILLDKAFGSDMQNTDYIDFHWPEAINIMVAADARSRVKTTRLLQDQPPLNSESRCNAAAESMSRAATMLDGPTLGYFVINQFGVIPSNRMQ